MKNTQEQIQKNYEDHSSYLDAATRKIMNLYYNFNQRIPDLYTNPKQYPKNCNYEKYDSKKNVKETMHLISDTYEGGYKAASTMKENIDYIKTKVIGGVAISISAFTLLQSNISAYQSYIKMGGVFLTGACVIEGVNQMILIPMNQKDQIVISNYNQEAQDYEYKNGVLEDEIRAMEDEFLVLKNDLKHLKEDTEKANSDVFKIEYMVSHSAEITTQNSAKLMAHLKKDFNYSNEDLMEKFNLSHEEIQQILNSSNNSDLLQLNHIEYTKYDATVDEDIDIDPIKPNEEITSSDELI